MIVEDALSKGLSSRRVGRLTRSLKVSGIACEPFPYVAYGYSEGERRFHVIDRALNRCIASLKGALAMFDEAIEDVEGEWVVHDLLMSQRRMLHNGIDVLIRSKKRVKYIPC